MKTSLNEVLARLHGVVTNGREYTALCPAHEDSTPSLSVRESETGKILLHCHAGCSYKDIADAIGLESDPQPLPSPSKPTETAVYSYLDEHGKLLFQKVRYEPKTFRVRRPGTGDTWEYKLGDTARVLYRLPELLIAKEAGRTIFFVEGEKDADRLHKAGLVATTLMEGASQPGQYQKWKPQYTDQLSGAKRVVCLPDNDAPGKSLAAMVFQQLRGKVGDIRLIELPGLPEKGDVSDWLDSGNTVEELQAIVKREFSSLNDTKSLNEWALSPSAKEMLKHFISAADLCNQPPTQTWLIQHYLAMDSLNVCVGETGSGKTTVLLDMACHVACGLPWRGNKVRKGQVLYIAGEGIHGISRRILGWATAHKVPTSMLSALTVKNTPISLLDIANIAALIEIVKLYVNPGVVMIIIDTINRNFGDGDENATKDMTIAVSALDALRNATGAAVIAVHHTGLSDKTRGRGSSVLKASADTEYMVESLDKTVQMKCTKSKDQEPPEVLAWFRVSQQLAWNDEDGFPLTAAVLTESNPINTNHISGSNERLIAELLEENGPTLSGDLRRLFQDKKPEQPLPSSKAAFFYSLRLLKEKGLVTEVNSTVELVSR